ncbi:hypothetical protein J1N35_013012 [Gossypium stocksii]|uniref:CCHC-type domain-containing protein n=1 Tax=Gossypium stocksii TaxID=47602 RepID=A0A9D3VU38_9ROSI|nr:hypothetical protein J1N35_013012 [Gossypium stocksii]
MTCTQCGQPGHNKRSCTNSKQSGRTTNSMSRATGKSSSTPKSRNNKRNAPLDHLGTQELVANHLAIAYDTL